VDTLAIDDLRDALVAVAVPADVDPMAAYMKNKFEFLGVRSPAARAASKPFLRAAKGVSGDELVAFVNQCWAQPEREFQYVAVTLTRKHVKKLEPSHLPDVENLITTKSWWDTVDSLAAWTVGPMVSAYPELGAVMDTWIEDDNLWLVRTAILHQLSYKESVDADRLFRYAERQAEHPDFFVRKAIGWALRQHARVDPDAVRAFVAEHDDQLSGLSKREALKHL
jgi:3-methyladenine DNA glycosylase AlkD